MGSSSSFQSPPHQYPLAIQLKLYQAFIFSIPILFSIILFLLFYLFYLKRRAYAVSSMQPVLPRTNNDLNIATVIQVDSGSMNELKNKLCRVIYDENLEERELLCCVCLGEYEAKEELVEVATCKHMFHGDCILHWLTNHSTCPLCRAPVFAVLHHHHHHYISHHAPPDLTNDYGELNHQHQVDMPQPHGESSSNSATNIC